MTRQARSAGSRPSPGWLKRLTIPSAIGLGAAGLLACGEECECQLPPESDCANSVDDDRNGLTDCADPVCQQAPGCLSELRCSDGVDNDVDGYADCLDCDCSADPFCSAVITILPCH